MKALYYLLTLLLVSCASAPREAAHRRLTGDEEALVVATFHQFYGLESEPWQGLVAETHGQAPPKKPVTHYYITVLRADPSTSLLAQFKTTKAVLHTGSRFHDGDGIHFSIEKITFDGVDSAVVQFDHYCGPLCGYSTSYCFERRAGTWKFVKVCGSETMS